MQELRLKLAAWCQPLHRYSKRNGGVCDRLYCAYSIDFTELWFYSLRVYPPLRERLKHLYTSIIPPLPMRNETPMRLPQRSVAGPSRSRERAVSKYTSCRQHYQCTYLWIRIPGSHEVRLWILRSLGSTTSCHRRRAS